MRRQDELGVRIAGWRIHTFLAGIQVVEPVLHAWLDLLFGLTIFLAFDHDFLDAVDVHSVGCAVDTFDKVGCAVVRAIFV
jgi:hypothetical protein